MRKLFTVLSAVTMALAFSLTASAATPIAKATRNQASKAPAAVSFDKSTVKTFSPRINVLHAKGAEKASQISTVKPISSFKFAPKPTLPSYAKANATAPMANLVGCVTYSPELDYGMYQIPSFDFVSAEPTTMYSATIAGDKYFVTGYEDYWLYQVPYTIVYDTTDWSIVGDVNYCDWDVLAQSMAYDPETDAVYGCFFTADLDGMELGTVNVDGAPGVRETTIATLDVAFYAMGFAADGTLYGIDDEGFFYTIDKTTGATEMVAETGLATQYLGGGAVDAKGNKFYYAPCYEDGSYLYAINLDDYSVELVAEFPEEVQGMYVAAPLAEDGAPAAATEVAANFAEGALTGEITFVMPATTFAGEDIEGELDYTVYCNGAAVAQGKAEAGNEVAETITVDAPGEYAFYVVCANEVGNSPKSQKIALWIGQDTPEAPENAEFEYKDGKATVTWDAVSTTVHEGYMDAEEVTYKVARVENWEETIVAEGLKDTIFVEDLATPDALTSIFYNIYACYDLLESDAAATNKVVLGTIIPPFTYDFESFDSLDIFNVIDANEDGRAWTWVDGEVRMSYNAYSDMDDWMISPAVELEAGWAYEFSVVARAQSVNYPERFEVLLGAEPTVEGMGIEVIAPTVVDNTDPATYSGIIAVAESGKYYFAIHGISDADKFYLYIDDIAISEKFDGSAPAAVTNVTFAGNYNGTPEVKISWTNPTTTVAKQELESIDKVEVSRNGEVVFTGAGEPGEEMTCTDTCPADGEYLYTIVAYNASGAGMAFNASAYAGVDLAAAPVDVEAVEWASTPGQVTISWTPVAEDINGMDIDPTLITYTILDIDQEIVAEDIPYATSEFTYIAAAEGEQFFGLWYVIPVTNKGYNVYAGGYGTTPMIPVGTPYDMPWVESCVDGAINTIIGCDGTGSSLAAKWTVASSCSNPACEPQDGDGGMFTWWPFEYDETILFSGKIKIDENENAAFSFYYFPTETESYQMMPIVKIGDFVYDQLDEWISNEGETAEWVRVVVPMVDYCGQTVQVGVKAICYDSSPYLCIDNLQVANMYAHDLGVKKFNAPRSIDAGKTGVISAVVENYGLQNAGEFAVTLLENGKAIETIDCEGLAAGAQETFVFAVATSLFSDAEYTYQVVVSYDEDEFEENNESINLTVRVAQSMLPAVEDLEAKEGTDGTAQLTWSAPNTESSIQTYVDDCEEYEAYAVDQAGDWTFIDADASDTYAFNGLTFPGNYEPMAFIVFDQTLDPALNGMAHSGDKAFACFAATDGQNDDWMISPELPGIAQTVSFAARSWTTQYGCEEFQFCYSTTSPAIADMEVLAEVHDVPGEWTEYSYDLPEGAKFFAIRCISQDRFVFLVDDITFSKGSDELVITGYDVYCGDELIAENVEDCEYTASDLANGTYTFFVVTNYTVGASALSNAAEVTITTSAIDNIDADDANAIYYNIQGMRIDNPANGTYIRVKGNKVEKVQVK